MLPHLVERFKKHKKAMLFKSIQESGFKLRKSSYGLYTNGDFKLSISGEHKLCKFVQTGLPKENQLKMYHFINCFWNINSFMENDELFIHVEMFNISKII